MAERRGGSMKAQVGLHELLAAQPELRSDQVEAVRKPAVLHGAVIRRPSRC